LRVHHLKRCARGCFSSSSTSPEKCSLFPS
jgi:hypothetical protein